MADRICSIESCGGNHYAHGWCHKHYQRWDLLGTTDDPPPRVFPFPDITGQRFGALIVIRREGPRWVCACDCGAETVVIAAALNNGNTTSCGCSRHLPRTRGLGSGYKAAHDRVRFDHGPARDHACVDCGSPARHWSYDHADPDEKSSGEGPYSLDPGYYQPRCALCHKRFDLDHISTNNNPEEAFS